VKPKKTKRPYRLRNWKQYNAALVRRGSLTLWVSPEVLAAWRDQGQAGQRGRPRRYADLAIMSMATLQEVYHLPLRAAEGLLVSVAALLRVALPVPDYTTLCRRRRTLAVALPRRPAEGPVHLVVDATGVKVFGEGEWKVRQHGYSKRRTWRKLHLAVNQATGEVLAAVVATNNFTDGQILPELLDQVGDPLAQVSGDGAYDKRNCYEAIRARRARAAIPPQQGARIWRHGNSKAERLARDQNLRRIRQVGRAAWKRECGYHRRSLAETAVFRLKTAFGARVSARSFAGQAAQMLVRCAALNQMTHLGMPDSYLVAA
jgi:IS5 family transposase